LPKKSADLNLVDEVFFVWWTQVRVLLLDPARYLSVSLVVALLFAYGVVLIVALE
jgi:hypothetical protein